MKSVLDEVLDAMYGPRMRVLMHSSRVEANRDLFEKEFPRHELIGSSEIPVDMVYLMPVENVDG